MMKSQTKVVVRNLPKSITESDFMKELSNVKYGINYLRFCGSGKYNRNLSARAYINFYNEDDMYEFKEQLENKPFLDESGNEIYSIVEFSVNQKVPGKSKVDNKQGTIATDSEFIKFMDELKEPKKHLPIGNVESNLEEIKNKELEKCTFKTPLIEFLSNIPKKERNKKDDYRRKLDYNKTLNKKDIENHNELKPNKNEVKVVKKNIGKDSQIEVTESVKGDTSKQKHLDKPNLKSKSVAQRNDIKTYATAYEDYEYDGWEKRGYESKMYRGGRLGGYEGDDRDGYYYSSRNQDQYYWNYNYGYSDYQSYSRPSAQTKVSKRLGGRRPPAYSATRKD